jgi:hypothetical protein
MYKVLDAESCSGGDTQQPADHSAAISQAKPIKKKTLHPPSVSLLYPVVNKEVEQQFSGRGVTRETCSTSLNVNDLGKAAVLHFA